MAQGGGPESGCRAVETELGLNSWDHGSSGEAWMGAAPRIKSSPKPQPASAPSPWTSPAPSPSTAPPTPPAPVSGRRVPRQNWAAAAGLILTGPVFGGKVTSRHILRTFAPAPAAAQGPLSLAIPGMGTSVLAQVSRFGARSSYFCRDRRAKFFGCKRECRGNACSADLPS